jgi:LysR family transcriptional regulator, mexEF-oprN operon transcriptional activator
VLTPVFTKPNVSITITLIKWIFFMKPINIIDLRKLDLNLLVVLFMIYEHRSVTVAAKALYLTQPAISAALARLRAQCGDELFVRQGRRLRATPYTETLIESLRPALAQIQASFAARGEFNPLTAQGTLRLGLADGLEMGLLPSITADLRRSAPGIRIRVNGTDFHAIQGQLENEELDLAFGVFNDLPKTVQREPLHRLSFRMLFDPRQHQISTRISIKQYVALDHVLVSYAPGFMGLFETKYESEGLARNIVVSTARFSSVPFLVQGSKLVCTMPDYLAYRFSRAFNLATIAAPFVDNTFDIEMVWPSYMTAEPDQQWLRDRLMRHVRLKDLIGT